MFIGCLEILFHGVLLQVFLPIILIGLSVFLTDLYEFFIYFEHINTIKATKRKRGTG